MRALLIACLVIALLVAGALAYVNMVWLPTSGKPWLERTLTDHTKLQVTIDHLAFRFPLGWVAADVRITDPAQRVPPLRLQHIHAQVAPWPLIRERLVRFVVFARMQSPLDTNAKVRGDYDWNMHALTARVRLPSLDLAQLREVWPAAWPAHVERGVLTCDVTVDAAPEQPLQVTGTLELRQLAATWRNPTAQLQGHVILTGKGRYDVARRRWLDYEGRLTLDDGALQAAGEAFRHLTGAARVAVNQFDDIQLRGEWRGRHLVAVTGHLRDWTQPHADLTLTARVQLDEELYPRLPRVVALAQPRGTMDITATWHGPLAASAQAQPSLPLDVTAVVAQGELRIPGWAEPITDIAGRLHYHADRVEVAPLTCTHAQILYTLTAQVDAISTEPHLVAHLQRSDLTSQLEAMLHENQISIARWDTVYHASRLKVMGDVARLTAPVVNLYSEGVLELSDLQRWPALAKRWTDWPLRGAVPFTAVASGPVREPRQLQGGVKLADVDVQFRTLPIHVQRAELRWQEGRAILQTLAAVVADGQVSATGHAAVPLADGPCEGTLTIDRMNLEPVLRAASPDKERYASGLLITRMTLAGDRCTSEALRGTGEFHVSEGRLASVPFLDKVLWGFLGGLAERLGYAELRRAEITQASGRWSLDDGKVHTDDTLLVAQYAASPIPIEIRGWVGLDQRLDLVVEPRLPADLLQNAPNIPPAIRALARAVAAVGDLKRLIGRQRVTGTLKQPVSRFELSIEELLRRLLRLNRKRRATLAG